MKEKLVLSLIWALEKGKLLTKGQTGLQVLKMKTIKKKKKKKL